MNIGNRIKEYISSKGIRQIDLANQLNVSKSTLSNVISGRFEPSKKFLESLSKASGKSINWWIFGEDEYREFSALNALVDMFLEDGSIDEKGTYNKDTEKVLINMLNKEIRDKIKKKQQN